MNTHADNAASEAKTSIYTLAFFALILIAAMVAFFISWEASAAVAVLASIAGRLSIVHCTAYRTRQPGGRLAVVTKRPA